MKNTILSLAFLFSAATTMAQDAYYHAPAKFTLSACAEAGVNLSTTTNDDKGYAETSKYRTGAKAGLLINANFNDRVDIRTGLYYSMKGVSYDKTSQYKSYNTWFGEVDQMAKLRINYIELPLSFLIHIGHKRNFYIGPGAYVAYALAGKTLYENGDEFGNKSYYSKDALFEQDKTGSPYIGAPPTIYNRLDYGIQASLGYRLPLGFFVQAQFSKGLARLISMPNNTYTNNFGSTITAGWMLNRR